MNKSDSLMHHQLPYRSRTLGNSYFLTELIIFPHCVAMIVAKMQQKTWGYWIGYYRKSDYEPFIWVNNAAAGYRHWAPGEPNNYVSHSQVYVPVI